jgi:hypothetical protein
MVLQWCRVMVPGFRIFVFQLALRQSWVSGAKNEYPKARHQPQAPTAPTDRTMSVNRMTRAGITNSG